QDAELGTDAVGEVGAVVLRAYIDIRGAELRAPVDDAHPGEQVDRTDRQEADSGERDAVDVALDLLAEDVVVARPEIDVVALDGLPVERPPAEDHLVRRRIGIEFDVAD